MGHGYSSAFPREQSAPSMERRALPPCNARSEPLMKLPKSESIRNCRRARLTTPAGGTSLGVALCHDGDRCALARRGSMKKPSCAGAKMRTDDRLAFGCAAKRYLGLLERQRARRPIIPIVARHLQLRLGRGALLAARASAERPRRCPAQRQVLCKGFTFESARERPLGPTPRLCSGLVAVHEKTFTFSVG